MAKKKTRKWEEFPTLVHLEGLQRSAMESRRRHKLVRYWCFRFKTLIEKGKKLKGIRILPGFMEFWLDQLPAYKINPMGEQVDIPEHLKKLTVGELGGYAQFAILWDVDPDLNVYLRHSSVWQEWNVILMSKVPVLGEY